MSYAQEINLLWSMLVGLSLALTLAIGAAALAVIESHWWRLQAIKRDPGLGGLDDAAPPFLCRLLDRYREGLR